MVPGLSSRSVIAHATCALLLACGGGHQEPGVAPHGHAGPRRLTGVTTISVATGLIGAQSAAVARELAIAELSAQLSEQLVGPEWAPQLQRANIAGVDWPGWLVANDVVRQASAGGGFTASLNAEQVEVVLGEMGHLEPAVDLRLPRAWQPTLSSAFVAERNWTLCQRRQQWLGVPCTIEPPLGDRMALSNLFAEVRLEPLLRDGTPVRKDGSLAWPLAVRVTQGVQALPGIPLQLVAADEANQATTTRAFVPRDAANVVVSDERGFGRFSEQHLEGGAQVAVEVTTLLGPLGKLVELPPVSVYTRALESKRHVVLEVSPGGERTPLAKAVFGGSVQRELVAAYGAVMPALAADVAGEVRADAVAAPLHRQLMGESLRQRVVESTHGTVDYLVLVWGHSEFASQMGAGRTWYEARVGAKVVEVWSGLIVAELEESATGAGIGDVAAEQAALDAAARKLVPRVQAALAAQ